MVAAGDTGPGFFGKMPAFGDFVRRRLPESFVAPWDTWLRDGLAASREALGGAWLECYLSAPLWRFALSPGICGDAAAAGVLMPSVDAVNRQYPLAITLLRPGSLNPFAVADAAHAWFAAVEEVALACLDPGIGLDVVDRRLGAIGMPVCREPLPARTAAAGDGAVWRLAATADAHLAADAYPRILADLAELRFGRYSLWWTAGSDRVSPQLRIHPDLPPAEAFAAMLCDEKPWVPAAELFAAGEAAPPPGADG